MASRNELMEIYRALRAHFGHRRWWPAEEPFEVMVGAVLTQNTSWGNVERALANLKEAGRLSPHAIDRMTHAALARLIRPSGYFNIKARRLKNLVAWFIRAYAGRVRNIKGRHTRRLRDELLGLSGIGPETADSILLYAFGRAVFVVDAYTRRVFYRHKWLSGGEEYEQVRALFESRLPRRPSLYNDFHAQIVAVGQHYCTPRNPRCDACPLGGFAMRREFQR